MIRAPSGSARTVQPSPACSTTTLTGIVQRHPARFFGLCVLPLQDKKAAQAELDRCVQQLGIRGILLYTNLAGRFPDEPQFRWLFARAEAFDVPILLHPALPLTAPPGERLRDDFHVGQHVR